MLFAYNCLIMKKKILIVEDDPAFLNILKLTLNESFNVLLANNGKEGVDLASTLLPDLILMDIMMPVMDGFNALALLKDNEVTATIPVIFLTGKVQFEDILEGFRKGADHYITKPFTSSQLLSCIDSFLNKTGRTSSLVSHHVTA